MAFVSIKNIEVEIVAMTAKLFHGDENCVLQYFFFIMNF